MPRVLLFSGSLGFSGTFVGSSSSYEGDSDRSGDEFHRLVDLHYAPLFRFAMSLTLAESDASDLVQETFLTWASKGHQLHDRAKAKSWLYTTLHRKFLESRRRITRFPHVEITEADADLPAVEADLPAHLDGIVVTDLLGEVDGQFQAAVALFYLEDYSYQEIAEILEVPLGTVKSRIARGLAQLKQLVQHRSASARAARKGTP